MHGTVRKKAIIDSVFGDYLKHLCNVRVSGDKKKLVMELFGEVDGSCIPEDKIRLFYGITMLGGCHVLCRKPKDRIISVVQGFHQMSGTDRIEVELRLQNFEFRNVRRLMKNVGGE